MIDLSRRSSLPELMDDEALPPEDYARCLHDLAAVNRINEDVDMVTVRFNYRFGGWGGGAPYRY